MSCFVGAPLGRQLRTILGNSGQHVGECRNRAHPRTTIRPATRSAFFFGWGITTSIVVNFQGPFSVDGNDQLNFVPARFAPRHRPDDVALNGERRNLGIRRYCL